MKLTRRQVEDILWAAEETARTSQDSEEVGAANLRRALCEDWMKHEEQIRSLASQLGSKAALVIQLEGTVLYSALDYKRVKAELDAAKEALKRLDEMAKRKEKDDGTTN